MIKKISVPDIHCQSCVNRITKALEEEKLNFNISLEEKTVTIDGSDQNLKTAVSAIEDLGFTPEKL